MKLPLFCTLPHTVMGEGVIVRVEIVARVTVEQDGDRYWAFGVNPGAVAASGSSVHDAVMKFRSAVQAVLVDLMDECSGDSQKFEVAVRDFVDSTDGVSVAEWEEARVQVRKGNSATEDLPLETRNISHSCTFTTATTPSRKDNIIAEAQPQVAA